MQANPALIGKRACAWPIDLRCAKPAPHLHPARASGKPVRNQKQDTGDEVTKTVVTLSDK
jgi:hypothetical protein